MSLNVIPTENDVHTTPAAGRIVTEQAWRRVFDSDSEDEGSFPLGRHNRVQAKPSTGFGNSPSGLNVDIAAGVLIAGGYVIEQTATETVALNASADNYVWLELTTSSGLVTGAQYRVETSAATIPSRGILLYRFTTNGSSVTATLDLRPVDSPTWIAGTYVGAADSVNVIVPCGFLPSLVTVCATSGSLPAGTRYKGISLTYNRITGPTSAATKSITLASYGFFVEGKSTNPSNEHLAIQAVTYEFMAYR